jgi:hypothetical protein
VLIYIIKDNNMSMTIIGGDNKKITIVTDQKIIKSLDNIKRKYDFFNTKYGSNINQNILNKNNCHYISQLCDTFGHKDIENLINEINYICSLDNLYHYIRYLLNKYKFIRILKTTIKKIKEKHQIPFKNKLYDDINDIKKIKYNIEIDTYLNIINEQSTILKNIKLEPHKNIDLIDNWQQSSKFNEELLYSIKYILSLNILIKENITPIYTALNNLTNLFTTKYL